MTASSDIMRAATECATSVMPRGKVSNRLIEAIAAALAAEREACAKLADEIGHKEWTDEAGCAAERMQEAIAIAIRARSTET